MFKLNGRWQAHEIMGRHNEEKKEKRRDEEKREEGRRDEGRREEVGKKGKDAKERAGGVQTGGCVEMTFNCQWSY